MSKEPSSNWLENTIVFLFAGIVLFAVVFAVYLIITTPPKDDSFSELYFNNHTQLPKEMIVGKSENIAFTVSASHEKKPANYIYGVYLEGYPETPEILFDPVKNETNPLIVSGKFTLNPEENKTIHYTFIPEKEHMSNESKRMVIYVTCNNKTYDIFLWCTIKDVK